MKGPAEDEFHCHRLSEHFPHFIDTHFKYLWFSIITKTPADDFYDDLFHDRSHLYFLPLLPSSLSRTHVAFTQRSLDVVQWALLRANSGFSSQ